MVYAFVIHTLFPGPCKVLFSQIFGTERNVLECDTEPSDGTDQRLLRKKQIEFVSSQAHSEYQFRRSVANRTVEEDIQSLNQEDQLPEFELGFFRLPEGQPFSSEKVVVWLGAGNTGFALVCHKNENRALAESVLKHLIRYLQEYVRVLSQPAEAALKADRVCLVLSKFLPDGALVFMNHRLQRSLERELEILMKT